MAVPERPKYEPLERVGNVVRESLNRAKQQNEKLTPHEKAERRIGYHLKDILKAGGYLRSAHIDGTTKDVLNARTEEEAVRMVNDIVENFERSLKSNPDLFKDLGKPIMFNTTFKEMLIHTTEGGNYYWDIDVVVNGDSVKVTAPLRSVG